MPTQFVDTIHTTSKQTAYVSKTDRPYMNS